MFGSSNGVRNYKRDLYNFQSCPVMHWSAKVDIRLHCTHNQHLIKTGSQCSNTAVNCNTIIYVFHSIWILLQVKAIHFLKQVNSAKSCVYVSIDSKTMWHSPNPTTPLALLKTHTHTIQTNKNKVYSHRDTSKKHKNIRISMPAYVMFFIWTSVLDGSSSKIWTRWLLPG